MTNQSTQPSGKPDDPFRMYASPVGAGFLQKANEIVEDYPARKYVLYSVLFVIEVIAVFSFALYLIH